MARLHISGSCRWRGDPRYVITYRAIVRLPGLYLRRRKRDIIRRAVHQFLMSTPPDKLDDLRNADQWPYIATELSNHMVSVEHVAVVMEYLDVLEQTVDDVRSLARYGNPGERQHRLLGTLPRIRIGASITLGLGAIALYLANGNALGMVAVGSLYIALLQYLNQYTLELRQPLLHIEVHPRRVRIDDEDCIGLCFVLWNRSRVAAANDVVFIARWHTPQNTGPELVWLPSDGDVEVDPLMANGIGVAWNYRSKPISVLRPLGGIWDSQQVGVLVIRKASAQFKLNCLLLGSNLYDQGSNFIDVYPHVDMPFMLIHDEKVLWNSTEKHWDIQ